MLTAIYDTLWHLIDVARSDFTFIKNYNDLLITKELQNKYVPRPFAIVSIIVILGIILNIEILFTKQLFKQSLDVNESITIRLNRTSSFQKFFLIILMLLAFVGTLIFMALVSAAMLHFVRIDLEQPDRVSMIVDQFFKTPVTAIMSCSVIGTIAFLLRSRLRLWYAVIEFCVGVYASYLSADFHDRSSSLQFAAGLYIIVRAFDNFEKAFEERPETYRLILPIWRSFFKNKKA